MECCPWPCRVRLRPPLRRVQLRILLRRIWLLIRALRSLSRELTHSLHTHEMSAHALLVMNNLGVEAFFEGNREVLDESVHTDDMGVDVDHVGIVDGDSASGDADLASVLE